MTRPLTCMLPLLSCALAATAGLAATKTETPGPAIDVTGAKFLSLRQKANGEYDATEATVLARIPDYSCYYWELSFRKKRGDAELTEEVVVPTAGGPTTARLRLPVDLSQGKASYRRCVSADDPAGAYSLTLREGDHVLKRFDFTVEEPKE